MHEVNPRADLNEKVESCVFTEKLFLAYQIKQITLTGIFKSKHDGISVFEGCVETANILVVHLFLNSYFSY